MISSPAPAVVVGSQPPVKPIWLSRPSYAHLLSWNPPLLSILLRCDSVSRLKQVHAHVLRSGDSLALSALFEFSALSNSRLYLPYTLRLFRSFDTPSLFSFNALLRSLSSSSSSYLSIHFFLQMLGSGISPNRYTYPFILKSLSAEFSLYLGKTVHGHAVKSGSASDFYVCSSLISFYSNCGNINDSKKLFGEMPEKNVVCWSAMISGLVHVGQFREALEIFGQFQEAGFEPNESILVSLLCSSAQLGALQLGKWVHLYLERKAVPLSVNLGTALVDMYCKCGVVEEGIEVFNKMTRRNVLSWTVVIAGLAINGMGRRAVEMFQDMIKKGIRPDSVTFVAVLTACSHGGLVEEAWSCFIAMRKKHGVIAKLEHYGCVVDVLGRAGLLHEALDFMKKMPMEPDYVMWRALLSACWVHRNVKMGELVGRFLIEQDPLYDANYILLSNIYAHAKRWTDAIEVRNIMRQRGVKKCPGCSVIEFDGIVHEFFVCNNLEPRYMELQPMLRVMAERLRSAGYVPNTSEVPLDIDEDQKQEALCYHSEKLALAFGLLKVDVGMPIRIVKNLRACIDCHSTAKIISKVFNREIIIRDRLRFHYFKDGACSCQDFW